MKGKKNSPDGRGERGACESQLFVENISSVIAKGLAPSKQLMINRWKCPRRVINDCKDNMNARYTARLGAL